MFAAKRGLEIVGGGPDSVDEDTPLVVSLPISCDAADFSVPGLEYSVVPR